MTKRDAIRPRPFAAVLVVLAAAGLIGGVAAANADDPKPAGSASAGGQVAESTHVDYPVNAAGQTYGVGDISVPVEEWPDLLLVETTEGKEGYVVRAELDAATGANVRSPEEAVAYQRRMDAATWDEILLNVYEADGQTVIGSFPVSRSHVIQE